jgi:hypothetical protein
MAKQHRMALLIGACVFFAFTPGSWEFSWGPNGTWGLMGAVMWAVIAGSLLTAALRLWRAGRFLMQAPGENER